MPLFGIIDKYITQNNGTGNQKSCSPAMIPAVGIVLTCRGQKKKGLPEAGDLNPGEGKNDY